MIAGSWSVQSVEGADVRLRSGRIGLVDVDVTAPVSWGVFRVDASRIALELSIALDRLRTSNFIMQAAARALIGRHQAHELRYQGTGTASEPWTVTGPATAGDVRLDLSLEVEHVSDAPVQIQLAGSARVGTIHLPLPGMGTVEDFSFQVTSRLILQPG